MELAMKNTGFEAWKARLEWFKGEFPFGPIQRFTNEEGNLHRDDGPALITPTRITHYKNGRKHGIDADKHGSIFFYYENVRIPKKFFYSPESLTLNEVLSNSNAEVRYVGMKIIGVDKGLGDKRTKIVDSCDNTGMILFEIDGIFDEPVMYLKGINSTEEPEIGRAHV